MYTKDHGKDVLICDQAIQMSWEPLLFMNYELWLAILVCVTVFVLCVVLANVKACVYDTYSTIVGSLLQT